ncbi:gliding motility protein GldB [Kaistella solincola]|uniref:Gliding motility protein GldB n=1 Tax=Kaistella solincola TaxID=510955 RepID=A0ABR4ZPJ0_9FLAO|nr:gliding motility protein GldB [Kaistella solincola]KIA82354.1 gliding motility protein GldB [Kaistella solincola]
MKFFKYLFFSVLFLSFSIACNKSKENNWKIDLKEPPQKVEITDISKEFYDSAVPLESFAKKYPWFQGTVPNDEFEIRRSDAEEQKIYTEAVSKIDLAKLQTDLGNLFAHVQYYFPDFQNPQVFLYSSALQGALEPVFYKPQENMLFIDVTGFMGDNNPNYAGMETYFQKSMNPQNILPKVSEVFAELFVPATGDRQKFLDELVYQGKIMILQDAFLPAEPDYLKINYTPKQYEWAQANEANIWNYFVENNLIFSDDMRLSERFIKPGPFSKFYTEIDNESSPQVGIFSGWQICKKYFKENPNTKLQDFLKMNAQDIFNESNYKPKN